MKRSLVIMLLAAVVALLLGVPWWVVAAAGGFLGGYAFRMVYGSFRGFLNAVWPRSRE